MSKLRRIPSRLKRIELVHIPYYSFDVAIERDGGEQHVRIAVDALLSNTTFFVSEELEFETPESPPACEFVLKASEARDAALEEYKGLLLEHGLRNKKASVVRDISDAECFYYPFWVGYFHGATGYDFRALDAVSGEPQGMKMRKVFLSAFRQMDLL